LWTASLPIPYISSSLPVQKSLVPPPPSPEEINRNPSQYHYQTDYGVGQILIYRVGNHYPAHRDKQNGRNRVPGYPIAAAAVGLGSKSRWRSPWSDGVRIIGAIPGVPFPEYENAGCGQTKEDEVNRNHVVQYLIVPSRKGNHDRQNPLQDYGNDRN